MAHAGVCPQWGPVDDKPLEPLGPHATTDESGAFALLVARGFTENGGKITFLAFNHERTQGALMELASSDIDKQVAVTLGPVYSAHYSIQVPAQVKMPHTAGFVVTTSGAALEPLWGTSGSVKLPPGAYVAEIHPGVDAERTSSLFVLGDRDITLPPIRVSTSIVARHYGRGTPRLSILQDMDHKPFQIDSLRGHWTLLYFWATWCGPCVQEGMPKLIAFVKQHSDSLDKFRIIAIHERSAGETGDWNDYYRKTIKLESTLWGSTPPFPLTYDETMRMTADWKIHEFPTYVLIDPQGKIVPDGSPALLAAVLSRKTAGKIAVP